MQHADSARRMTNQESKEGARTLQVPAAFTTSLTSTLFLLQMAQARHSKSRAGSRARVPQVQSSKDQFHREWCSSSQTSEDHKGPSQQGREILCSSGYQIESYQLLHEAKQLCVKHSAQSKFSQPVSPDHRRLTPPLPEHGSSRHQSSLRMGEAAVVSCSSVSLGFYLHDFRWSSWVARQTLRQEWWPDSYSYPTKTSF